jgi:CubicO group peptidase (beta-lactamase class C family)
VNSTNVDKQQQAPSSVGGLDGSLSRRALLKGTAALGFGVAAGTLLGHSASSARAAPAAGQASEWPPFDQAVQNAMQTFGMVGAAIGVVNAHDILHLQTFGVRDQNSSAPMTPDTLFRVGSVTKSMTSLLLATFVDDGTLAWDQPVIDAWPDFRAPTDELTKTLRVRDLMGMATGLGETAAVGLHYDYPSAIEVMHGMAYLPVLTPPYTEHAT